MSERTLAIIKPDAVKKNAIGDIIKMYEAAGLRPVAIRMMRMPKPTAEGFYAVHKARPFFDSLTTFTASGPVVVLVLEGTDAIKRLILRAVHRIGGHALIDRSLWSIAIVSWISALLGAHFLIILILAGIAYVLLKKSYYIPASDHRYYPCRRISFLFYEFGEPWHSFENSSTNCNII